jgi:hypothetical protein
MSSKTAMEGVIRYALSLTMSTIGVWFSAGLFNATVLAPILGHDRAREMLLTPPYPLLIGWGLLVGYVAQIRWKRFCTPWVWVLPAIYLTLGIIAWLHTGYTFVDSVHHFFRRDCSPFCQDQYQRTCPLYSSLAFSLGLVLHKLRPSAADRAREG